MLSLLALQLQINLLLTAPESGWTWTIGVIIRTEFVYIP
jgi:hypothetical protein